MSIPLIYIVLVHCSVFIYGAVQNTTCTTPNGEKALCIPIHLCDVIQDAILTLNNSAIEFARNSQCGYDDDPLVCCGTVGFPILTDLPPESHLLPNRAECGFDVAQDRIYGGSATELNEFPWMCLLEYQYKDGSSAGYKCGGSLISRRYVLTAAHCIVTNDLTLASVRLGEWRISTEEDCTELIANRECNDPVIDVPIEKAIAHPQYSRRTGENDIGLLRLQRNVNFSAFIKPICLPSYYSPTKDVGTPMTIAGWGSNENSSQSDVKLKASVPIVAMSTCKAKFGARGTVTDNHVCAGGVQGRDACQGDSGGPLMGTFMNQTSYLLQWYLEGVVAWGIGCGRREFPGIYTRVAKYMMWILETMTEF